MVAWVFRLLIIATAWLFFASRNWNALIWVAIALVQHERAEFLRRMYQ